MSKRKSEQDLLSDLIHCHLRKQEDFLINLGNPYYNFMERLETTVSSYQYYDFDLLEDIVIGAVSSCQTFPESISAFYQQLMQEITHSFQVSASPHYLVWPLQKALYHRINAGASIILAIERLHHFIQTCEVHRCIYLSQQMLLRHQLVYDYELYQISIHFPAFQHLASPDSIVPYT